MHGQFQLNILFVHHFDESLTIVRVETVILFQNLNQFLETEIYKLSKICPIKSGIYSSIFKYTPSNHNG